jgi:hypothetical protein
LAARVEYSECFDDDDVAETGGLMIDRVEPIVPACLDGAGVAGTVVVVVVVVGMVLWLLRLLLF